MKRLTITLLLLTIMVAATAAAGYFTLQSAFAGCQFHARSLESASAQEIENQALSYACANIKSKGGAPKVRLNRSITPAEYMSFFGDTPGLCQDQQLSIVVLQGDFELTGINYMSAQPPRATFVGIVFDRKVGIPAIISHSRTGDRFREILNDNSLPKSKVPLIPARQQIRACTYGQAAPPPAPPPKN